MGTAALAAEEASSALDHENDVAGRWWGTESAVQTKLPVRYYPRTGTLSRWSRR